MLKENNVRSFKNKSFQIEFYLSSPYLGVDKSLKNKPKKTEVIPVHEKVKIESKYKSKTLKEQREDSFFDPSETDEELKL